jgi:hypothetical protein
MVWISENKPAEVVAQPAESVQSTVVFEETTENIIKAETSDSEPATENEITEENSSTDSE